MGTTLGFMAFAVIGVSTAWWFRLAFAVALPENRAAFVVSWIAGGVLAVAALVEGPGWLGGVPAVLALVGAAFLLFTFAISAQKLGADALALGAPLPAFSAPDETGAEFSSSSLTGKPVLLKFFRGHW